MLVKDGYTGKYIDQVLCNKILRWTPDNTKNKKVKNVLANNRTIVSSHGHHVFVAHEAVKVQTEQDDWDGEMYGHHVM